MAIAMEEDYLGRSGTKLNRKLKFVVTGTDDDGTARAYVEANVPSTHDGLVARSVSSISQEADERWVFTVDYGALSLFDIPEPDPGTASYTINFQEEPKTYYYSENRLAKHPVGAPEVINGLIGIQLADGQGRHAGITVPAGPITDTITYEYPNAVIPASYRNIVKALRGGVNDATFLGNPAGSMRFVSCSAQVTSTGKQTITFGWAYQDAKTVTVGPHGLGSIDGWDFWWSIDETTVLSDPDGREVPIVTPKFVYVERLLPRVDFGTLGLPGV